VIHRRKRGQGLVEVSLVVALVAIAAITILTVAGGTISQVFSNVVCDVQGGDPSVFPTSPCAHFTPSPGGSPSPSAAPSTSPSASPDADSAEDTTNSTNDTGADADPGALPLTGGRYVYVLNAPASFPSFPYVSPANGTLTRIDSAGTQTNLAVGRVPTAMAITPDGSKIYVLNRGDNWVGGPLPGSANSATVSVISAASFTVTATIPVRNLAGTQDASATAIATSNTNTYVTSGAGCSSSLDPCPSNSDGWSVMVINHATSAVSHISWTNVVCGASDTVYALAFGSCGPGENLSNIVITADGNTGYVIDSNNYDVTKLSNLNSTPSVDPTDLTQERGVPGGYTDSYASFPYNIALDASSGYVLDFSPDGSGIDHGIVIPFNLSSLVFGVGTEIGISGPTEMVVTNSNVYSVTYGINDIGYNAIPLAGGTGSVIAIPGNGSCDAVIGLNQLAYDAVDGIIWEADCADSTVITVDAPTNTVVGTPISVPNFAVAVVAG
jgi:DNA-binding beta-propeller fold protein YncE